MKYYATISMMFVVCYLQAQHINLNKYTIEDGLVNNDILNIYQDSRGFIWLCTRGGLSRYDGSRFTNFTTDNGLTNDMINDIIEIGPQEFMVAQNSEGPRLLKNGRLGPLIPGNKLIINRFYSPDKKHLLATTDYMGIMQWEKGAFSPVNPAYIKNVSEITALNDSLWLLHEQDAAAQLVTPSLQAWSSATPLYATTVFTDSRHQTWIGTFNGLKLLDPATQRGKPIQVLPPPSSFNFPLLKETIIKVIMEDSKSNYWIGTDNGLVKIDKNGASYIYTQQDGLPSTFINCIKEDRQHNIWVGTQNGLVKFSLNSTISAISGNTDNSNGYATVMPVTYERIRLFDGKAVNELNLSTGILTNTLNLAGYRIYEPGKNELLITQGNKAWVYQNGKETVETIEWPGVNFYTTARINKKYFIGSGAGKLFLISDGNYTEILNLPSAQRIEHLAPGKKILWAGTAEDGLFKISISQKNDSFLLTLIDTLSGRLPDKHIRAFFSDKENELWIGTRYSGAIRLLELPDGKYEIQHYGTAQGLSSNIVRTISRDATGNIWIGSAQGLDKLIPEGNGYRVFNIGKLNKFLSRVSDICLLKNKYLLAVSYPSLLLVQDRHQDTISASPVYITNVSTSPSDTSSLMYKNNNRLPYGKAQIYFEFSSPQYINEDFTQYSYRLQGGNDTSWNISEKSRSVYFANLRPGSYSFQVRALGFNGQWSKPTSYNFIVNTPFWQRAWFILLMISIIGLLVYVFYRYRMQQLIRLQKVRNRIATDLHDEIGSNLTNISILTNLGKKNLSEPAKATDFLQRIAEEVSSSSQALDDIIWSVNSSHDTMEQTVARMRRYAAELFDAANIRYELQLDPVFEEKKLAMEQRRDIYLLFKESVNNISKHAGAGEVSIQLAIAHNQLLLLIKDDGKGFDTEKEFNRHGLKGMKARVHKWKGKITIESVEQKGTIIEIRLPLSKQ
jgi:signal transduction histidine kinase/ligand-binding sensor domain-containing protein